MRAKTWSLVVASVALGVAISAVGCAEKKKPSPSPVAQAPAPKAAPAPAPPPDTLTMRVDATPPKPPPPPAPNPCAELRERLARVNVHFDFDRASIAPAAVQEVDAIATAIKGSGMGPGAEFSIEGHCDATGSDGYNVALSERRAKTVLDRLVDLGAINPNHAKTVPWGKQKPLDPANTPEAYAKNRRVEVLVYCPVK